MKSKEQDLSKSSPNRKTKKSPVEPPIESNHFSEYKGTAKMKKNPEKETLISAAKATAPDHQPSIMAQMPIKKRLSVQFYPVEHVQFISTRLEKKWARLWNQRGPDGNVDTDAKIFIRIIQIGRKTKREKRRIFIDNSMVSTKWREENREILKSRYVGERNILVELQNLLTTNVKRNVQKMRFKEILDYLN